MLPKETQAIAEMRDLFTVVTQNFKKEALRLSELSLAEISEHLVNNAAEPLSQSHHKQVMVWNQFMNAIGQYFSQGGVLTQNERIY